MFIYEDLAAASHVPSRSRVQPSPCHCSTRWCRQPRLLLRPRPSRPSRFGFIYVPHGADMASWTPAAAGTGFELSPTLRRSRPSRTQIVVVSNLEARGWPGRDARRRRERLVERRDPEADRSRGPGVRHDDRSGAGEADRTVVAVPVARVRHGRLHRLRRRMHAGLQLRVSRRDLVGDADNAAADGDQPARGLRAVSSATAARTRSVDTTCVRIAASSTAS